MDKWIEDAAYDINAVIGRNFQGIIEKTILGHYEHFKQKPQPEFVKGTGNVERVHGYGPATRLTVYWQGDMRLIPKNKSGHYAVRPYSDHGVYPVQFIDKA